MSGLYRPQAPDNVVTWIEKHGHGEFSGPQRLNEEALTDEAQSMVSTFSDNSAKPISCLESSEQHRVRLATIKSPAEFWGVILPPLDQPWTEKNPFYRVLKMESKLDDMYGQEVKAKGSISPKDVQKGMLVAARLGPGYHWHRARIVDIIYKPGYVTARVFLIDYGDYSDEIPLKSGIRKLPGGMKLFPRPLAIPIVLQGLQPLSWKANFEKGDMSFDQTNASKWTEAAMKLVLEIWKSSPNKIAILSNYKIDHLGRYHGVLAFTGYNLKVVLNQVLVKSGHAKFSEEEFYSQLGAKTETVAGPKFLSICGSGAEKGTVSIDDSVDFVNKDINIEDYLPSPSHETSFHNATQGSSSFNVKELTALKYLDPKTGTKPNTYNRMSRSTIDRFRASTPMGGSFASSRANSICGEPLNRSFLIGGERAKLVGSQGKKISHEKLMAALKAKKLSMCETESVASLSELDRSTTQTQSTFWESFRESDEEDWSEEESLQGLDEEERRKKRQERRNRKALMNNSKIQRLPAGVDTGKFLEEQLRQIQHSGIGPKRVFDYLK